MRQKQNLSTCHYERKSEGRICSNKIEELGKDWVLYPQLLKLFSGSDCLINFVIIIQIIQRCLNNYNENDERNFSYLCLNFNL